jgi:hypothetical protein
MITTGANGIKHDRAKADKSVPAGYQGSHKNLPSKNLRQGVDSTKHRSGAVTRSKGVALAVSDINKYPAILDIRTFSTIFVL